MSGIRDVDRVNMMHENPELRWSFIRKVYSIAIFQLLLNIMVVSVLVFVPPVAEFFNNYVPYYVLCIFILFGQCSDLLSSSS
ncbi:BI1-like protein [Trifolium medium]|uniref:BI1-like protein n=1 Tax=Trifolium medium TaxID=97028 RepID=A0A392R6Y4_9FABA|nr:BI1-like protein [Trifolium medium]